MPDTYTPNPFDPGAQPPKPEQSRLKLKGSGPGDLPDAASIPPLDEPVGPAAEPAGSLIPVDSAPDTAPAQPRKPRRLRTLLLAAVLGGGFGLAATLALKALLTDGAPQPAAPADRPAGMAAAPQEPASGTASAPVPDVPAEPPTTAEAYLKVLRGQRLMLSGNPRGVFINAVFYPEGGMLHPQFGLAIGQIQLDGPVPMVEVLDAAGAIHLIPLQGVR